MALGGDSNPAADHDRDRRGSSPATGWWATRTASSSCLPARAEDVLRAAEEKVGTENLVRDAVRDGMTPLEAFERYGAF